MPVIQKLASSLGKRDEVPNIELAKQVAKKNDTVAIKELVQNLTAKNKDSRYDCIKVLYEVGKLNPSLVAAYSNEFLSLLKSPDNRMQWGAMTALNTITTEKPAIIYKALPQILDAAGKGSVITRDHAVNILIKLCSLKAYTTDAFSFLNELLITAAPNQLPMYAENAIGIINEKNKTAFIKTLRSRLDDIEKDTKKKRVEKVIAKLLK